MAVSYNENFPLEIILHWFWEFWLAAENFSTNQSTQNHRCIILRWKSFGLKFEIFPAKSFKKEI